LLSKPLKTESKPFHIIFLISAAPIPKNFDIPFWTELWKMMSQTSNIAKVLIVNDMFKFVLPWIFRPELYCHLLFCLIVFMCQTTEIALLFYNSNFTVLSMSTRNIFTAVWRFCCCIVIQGLVLKFCSIKILQCNCFCQKQTGSKILFFVRL